MLSGNRELTRYLGLRAAERVPVKNGPIDCRWIRYALFDGPRDPAPETEDMP